MRTLFCLALVWGGVAAADIVVGPELPVGGTGSSTQTSPVVIFDGTDYVVAWTDDASGSAARVGARVTRTGTVLDTTPLSILPSTVTPEGMAGSPSGAIVTWIDTGEAFEAVMGTDGQLSASHDLGMTPTFVSALGSSAGYLVVGSTPSSNAQTVRVSGDGTVEDATPATISSSPLGVLGAGGGSKYMLSHWVSGTEIDAQLVDPTVSAAGSDFFVNDPTSELLGVVATGTNFMVMFDGKGSLYANTNAIFQRTITLAQIPSLWDGSALVAIDFAGKLSRLSETDGSTIDGPTSLGVVPLATATSAQEDDLIVYLVSNRVKARLVTLAAPQQPDAGVTAADAAPGTPDAAPAGTPDAAPAGSPDAAPAGSPDAGTTTGGKKSGCGCTVGGDAPPAAALLFLLFAGALLVSARGRRNS
jgi:MYXO-CTERM domain-containing protein